MQPDVEAQRQRDYFEEQKRAERAAEAAAFMEKHGLKTAEDCRRFAREKYKSFRDRGPSFEVWCQTMKQPAVDWIARGESREDKRLLQRLRDMAVIDEDNKLIPLAERPQRAARIQAERMAADAELEARRKLLNKQAEQQQETPA